MKRRLLLLRSTACAAAWPCAALPSAAAATQARAARRAHAARDAGRSYAGHPAAIAFAAEVAARRGWSLDWVERQLAKAHRVPAVQRLVMPPPPGTAKNWAAYRARFVDAARIEAGLDFWESARPWLEQAQQRFGVPPEIVVAIVGVETYYGRIMGSFSVLDALATLAFDFPAGRRNRSDYFRGELEELLAWAQRTPFDPAQLKGSYAGASGLPQFMPGSVNRHAVDFDGNGRVDLSGSLADVVGSVANFLAGHGWQRGMATHHAVAMPVDTPARARLLAPDIEPSFTPQQIAELGAELTPAGQAHTGLLAVIELQNGDAAPSHVAGTQNFYVITRYNRSSYYAMAVIDLADELARAQRRRPEQ